MKLITGDVHAGTRVSDDAELVPCDVGSAFAAGEMEDERGVRRFVSMRVARFVDGKAQAPIYELIWASPNALEEFLRGAIDFGQRQWNVYFDARAAEQTARARLDAAVEKQRADAAEHQATELGKACEVFKATIETLEDDRDHAKAEFQISNEHLAKALVRVAELEEALFERCQRAADGGRGCGLDSPSKLCEPCSVAAGEDPRWIEKHDAATKRSTLEEAAAHFETVPHHVPSIGGEGGLVSFGRIAADVLRARAAGPAATPDVPRGAVIEAEVSVRVKPPKR